MLFLVGAAAKDKAWRRDVYDLSALGTPLNRKE